MCVLGFHETVEKAEVIINQRENRKGSIALIPFRNNKRKIKYGSAQSL